MGFNWGPTSLLVHSLPRKKINHTIMSMGRHVDAQYSPNKE